MKITGFIWLEHIVDKLWEKHGVGPDEVRELLQNSPMFRRVERGHRPTEDVYSASGQTSDGRYLIAFFVHKQDGKALVLSARDMTHSERRLYERH